MCRRCGTTKAVSEFRALKSAKDGLQSWCRFCRNEYSKLYMREHVKKPGVREANNERDKRRYHEVIKGDPVAIEAKRVRAKEYQTRPEVKERLKSYRAEYVKRPGKREELRAKAKAWVDANRDKARAYWSKYYKTDRGRIRHAMQQNKRRAKLKLAICDFTHAQWLAIQEAFGWACAYCGIDSVPMTMDHVIPIANGGHDTASNIVPACLSCNSRKNNRSAEEFRAELARERERVA
jgi:5-methylcytosine-specific restriction endonuclease McrA